MLHRSIIVHHALPIHRTIESRTSRPTIDGSLPMKTMILAAVGVLSVGVGTVFAQGAPLGFEPPAYSAHAFTDHSKDAQVQFLGPNTVLGKMFNHSSDSNRVATNASTKG
jgi:hypothetical protein